MQEIQNTYQPDFDQNMNNPNQQAQPGQYQQYGQSSGYYQQAPQPQNIRQQQYGNPQYIPEPVMSGGAKAGWLFLSFFLGTIGYIITAAVCQGKSDEYAYQAAKMSMIGLIIGTVIAIIAVIIMIFILIAVIGAFAFTY